MNDNYSVHYAQGANVEDTGLPPALVAGDTPALVTQDFVLNVSALIPQYTPLMSSGNNFVPWTAGNEVAAIAPFDLEPGVYRKALITAVMANVDAIKWPAGTTEVQADAAQTGMIRYRKLLHSDKRTGNESVYVGPGNEAGGQPLGLTGGALPGGTESAAYSFDLDTRVAGGQGARTWALASGTLPAGVTLNTSTGVLSGTVGAAASGTYTPTFSVTDSQGNVQSASFSLVIADA